MGGDTPIEWTDATWNPVRGCSRVSPGCVNCYAEKVAARFSGPGLAYEGLATVWHQRKEELGGIVLYRGGARWTGEVRMVPERLADPLRWTKPRRIFVNSMSDLFHEKLERRWIAACFGIMALASHHTYQILTKRAERMRDIMSTLTLEECFDALPDEIGPITGAKSKRIADQMRAKGIDPLDTALERFPLPWIWLGVSVEDQQRADERIPLLLQTPAAVRFISAEPLLGPVDLADITLPDELAAAVRMSFAKINALTDHDDEHVYNDHAKLDWVIVGGESGADARPFDIAWARSIVGQCKATGVPVFVKQMGSNAIDSSLVDIIGPDGKVHYTRMLDSEHLADARVRIADGRAQGYTITAHNVSRILGSKKGGDMAEWPDDLRVREFPEAP